MFIEINYYCKKCLLLHWVQGSQSKGFNYGVSLVNFKRIVFFTKVRCQRGFSTEIF
jgi:hypothetical protein